MTSFADIPPTVARLLTGTPGGVGEALLGGAPARAQRVAVVLLDGFGWRFVQRHGDHPLLRGLDAVTRIDAQFPSTTTAHVTTMHSGRPVGEHGLYEWNVYEPLLDEVIIPIRFSHAAGTEGDTLRGTGLDLRDVLPPGSFYDALAEHGVASVVLQPAEFSPSTYDEAAATGAELRPFGTVEEGARELAAALAGRGPRYAYFYWHRIDAKGHEHGPDSREFDVACVRALDAVQAGLEGLPPGTVVLITADHGQVAVDPSRTDYLDELVPGLHDLLRRGAGGRPLAPAGSARDVFLHAAPGRAADLAERLRAGLGDRGAVHLCAELEAQGRFGAVGPRLRARLADVCVLPAKGRMAWLRSHPSVEQRFRGHHGGLDPDEALTWLGATVAG